MAKPRILRILRARVKVGREREWDRLMDAQIADQLIGADGLLDWYRGSPTDYEGSDFVVVTIWRDMDAVRQWAGASAGPVLVGAQHAVAESISIEQFELNE
jgi:heme-degrading monooxygenase HmoA